MVCSCDYYEVFTRVRLITNARALSRHRMTLSRTSDALVFHGRLETFSQNIILHSACFVFVAWGHCRILTPPAFNFRSTLIAVHFLIWVAVRQSLHSTSTGVAQYSFLMLILKHVTQQCELVHAVNSPGTKAYIKLERGMPFLLFLIPLSICVIWPCFSKCI